MPGASMVARRNCANCVCDGRDKAGHYIPVSLACYIAKCRIHEKQTHCGPVFGWILLGGVWRRGVAPRGAGDREAGKVFKRTHRVVGEGMAGAKGAPGAQWSSGECPRRATPKFTTHPQKTPGRSSTSTAPPSSRPASPT